MIARTSEAERILEAYADATQIAASAQLIARLQEGVTAERVAQAGARGRLRSLLSVPRSARPSRVGWRHLGAPVRPQLTFALRLQSLALVLLTAIALGAVGGGAGAVLVSVLRQPDPTMDQPGPNVLPAPVVPAPASSAEPVPASSAVPASAVPVPASSAVPASSTTSGPTTSPAVSVRVLAQRLPGSRPTKAERRARARADARAAVRARPVCVAPNATVPDETAVVVPRRAATGEPCPF